MSPIAIVVVAWLSVNVLMVLLALNWAAARKRALSGRSRDMVDAAEQHANVGVPASGPAVGASLSSARRRASMT
jgi:hypothetical protein